MCNPTFDNSTSDRPLSPMTAKGIQQMDLFRMGTVFVLTDYVYLYNVSILSSNFESIQRLHPQRIFNLNFMIII